MQIKVLLYLVAVWESESLFEYKCSRLVLKDVRDGDNLRDSGKLFQRDAPQFYNFIQIRLITTYHTNET